MKMPWQVPGRRERGTPGDRFGGACYDAVVAIVVGLAGILALVQTGRSIASRAGVDAAIFFGVALFLFIAVMRKVARLRGPSTRE